MSISVLTKGMSCLFFCFCVCCMNAQVRNTDPVRHLRISGYLGQRIDACIEYRVKAQDVDHLVEPFRHKEETSRWQSEFWGKWIQGAIASYRYDKDPELYKIIKNGAELLMETQLPNGYIGNYSEEAQLNQWDIWGRKYTALGLIAYYDLSGENQTFGCGKRPATGISAIALLINRGPSGVSHCFMMYLAKSRYLSCRVRLYRYITGSSTEELGIPI